MARFQAIADRVDELERMLLSGVDAGERLIVQTEALRHGGGTAGGSVPVVAAGGGSAKVPVSAMPDKPEPVAPEPAKPPMPRLTNADFGKVIDALPPRLAVYLHLPPIDAPYYPSG